MIKGTKGKAIPITVSIIDNNQPVSGLTVPYAIKRNSDGVTIASGNMTESQAGLYFAEVTVNETGSFRVEVTPAGYPPDVEELWITTEEDDTTIILGLVKNNIRMLNPVYDSNGMLTSATLKIYPSSTDANNDTNAIKAFQVTASYDAQGNCTDYKVVEA